MCVGVRTRWAARTVHEEQDKTDGASFDVDGASFDDDGASCDVDGASCDFYGAIL